MIRDLDTGKVMKNAFRITKNKYVTALRVRIPGGALSAETLKMVADIANKYGDGSVHMTTRQGFEILNIPMEYMEEVNKEIDR